MKTIVVGLGLIGGSIALDLKEKKFATEVVGVDLRSDHGKQALDLGLVDQVTGLTQALQGADLVVLAIPMSAMNRLLPQILNEASENTSITDVGSTKGKLAQLVQDHPKRRQYVPSHPMAGTENSGPQAALRGLFAGKTAVICDKDQSAGHHLKRVEAMYDALEMRMIYMSSTEHDIHAAFVSHLSHISSFVLANTVLDMEKNVATIFDLAGGGFESTVRLAKSSPEMWTPIFEQNADSVEHALDAYIGHLKEFQSALREKKWDKIQTQLKRANEIRRVLQSIDDKKKVTR
jgi:prephenate dehydrogenase